MTMQKFPTSSIEYTILPHITHVPALSASQRLWMGWIEDRFAAREVRSYEGPRKALLSRPVASYQIEQSWYLEPATELYHAP